MGEALLDKIAHGWYDMNKDGVYDDLFLTWSRKAFSSAIGGEVWSNAEDLAKWAKALFHDKTVLKQESIDQMLTFHSPCTGEEFFTSGYGLGVVRINPEIVNGLVAYGHGGNAPGYGAATLYFPEYHFSMGLMDNTEEGESIGETIKNLLDVLKEHFGGN
jgi:D-alanyl-D-alanine carboxypeptidase